MGIKINDDNLNLSEVQEFNSKVRAFLVDSNNNVLIANYGNVILLPGGSIDKDETNEEAIIRELVEETGCNYTAEELEFLNTIEFYQRDYPKRDGSKLNRLVTTHYYVGPFKGINKQSLTEKEKKGKFKLELINLDELEEYVRNHQSDNPRNQYFVIELLKILANYREFSSSPQRILSQNKNNQQ